MHGQAREGGNRGSEADYCGWLTVENNIKWTDYIVLVASVWILDHHNPNMSTLWVHGDRSKINQENI